MDYRGYRPDVDGLRGVAILAVLLYHYRVPGIHGGFVGVDIFFVFSGFLISRNVFHDIQAGTWSYARFYTRRARRLFPALFATLVLSFIAAVVLLMPNDLEWFATTALHSAVSTSNLLYWLELGYFGPDAGRTALLHTWSLSVEEQFYLIWPLLMLLMLGRGRRGPAPLVLTLLAAGAASVWAAQWLLQSDARAAFYLMPFRIIEFAAGGLLVWLPRLSRRWLWAEEALLLAGLGVLLGVTLTYRSTMPYPGVNALLPTLGAALAIYAGQAPRAGLLLRNAALVWIGLISYSLYLVHWPLLVFTEVTLLRPIAGVEIPLLLSAAIALAALMVHFIERPFREAPRRPVHLSPAAFGLSCAGLTIALLWTAATVLIGNGWSWRMPAEVRAPLSGLEFARNARETRNRTGVCHLNMWAGKTADGGYVNERCLRIDPTRPNYLIIGDSHAADRYAGLSALFTPVNFLQMTTAGCRPLLDNPFWEFHCRERVAYVFRDFLPRARIDGVILAARWQREDLEPLRATLDYLQRLGETDANGHARALRVIVLGPAVEFSPAVPDLVFRHRRTEGLDEWVSRFVVPERRELDRDLRAVANAAKVEYYSLIDSFCRDRRCPVLSSDGKMLIVDYGHQSPEGALVQAQGLQEFGLTLPRIAPIAAQRGSGGGMPEDMAGETAATGG